MRIVLFVITSLVAFGQGDKSLAFDAASVKPVTMPGPGRGMVMMARGRGGPGTSDPGRVSYPMTTLKNLLMIAYDVKDFQISGPSWLDTERFAVQATMPPETTKDQMHVMLQNLLAERFQVKVHRETKELPMYAMVVSKGGLKMKESAPPPPESKDAPKEDAPPPPPLPGIGGTPMKFGADGFPVLPPMGGGRGGLFMIMTPMGSKLTGQGQTIQELADRLSSLLTKPVVNQTELTAKYDFTLTFSMEGMPNAMMAPPPPPPGGGEAGRKMPEIDAPLNLFGAVQAQLGLKLDSKKGPVDLVVVDHAEKTPTEN
jgi:uncharacterized protein (TIGR03435 family)